jgi:hypothetical protein
LPAEVADQLLLEPAPIPVGTKKAHIVVVLPPWFDVISASWGVAIQQVIQNTLA